jgi:very-short-patch-repair endonuclease
MKQFEKRSALNGSLPPILSLKERERNVNPLPEGEGGRRPGEAPVAVNNNFLTNYPARKEIARTLRRTPTDAENKLWSRLRNRRLGGFKFRRQFPLAGFVADFCCFERKVVIEVDGSQHIDQTDRDDNRSVSMAELGFRTLRFWNHDVLQNMDVVCQQILDVLKKG